MIQATALRLAGEHEGISFLPPVIIANARHEALVTSQMAEIGVTPAALVLEPIGRNTAATALLAARIGLELDPEALVLLSPADHVIADPAGFRDVIARAAVLADERIVTFGIEPTGPETGYGYIERGQELTDGTYAIKRFREKPSLDLARTLIANGRHSWNAGIFLFASRLCVDEFDHAPDIRAAVDAALAAAVREKGVVRLSLEEFSATPSSPFDIAIMEKTSKAAVALCAIGWADVGSWSAIWELGVAAGGSVVTQGPVVAVDCSDTLVLSEGVNVAVSGVSNLIVVATATGVLVLPRDRAQDVKQLTALLAEKAHSKPQH